MHVVGGLEKRPPQGVVGGARNGGIAIRGNTDTSDLARVALENEEALAGLQVPHPTHSAGSVREACKWSGGVENAHLRVLSREPEMAVLPSGAIPPFPAPARTTKPHKSSAPHANHTTNKLSAPSCYQLNRQSTTHKRTAESCRRSQKWRYCHPGQYRHNRPSSCGP